jgi:hypothetical protein
MNRVVDVKKHDNLDLYPISIPKEKRKKQRLVNIDNNLMSIINLK